MKVVLLKPYRVYAQACEKNTNDECNVKLHIKQSTHEWKCTNRSALLSWLYSDLHLFSSKDSCNLRVASCPLVLPSLPASADNCFCSSRCRVWRKGCWWKAKIVCGWKKWEFLPATFLNKIHARGATIRWKTAVVRVTGTDSHWCANVQFLVGCLQKKGFFLRLVEPFRHLFPLFPSNFLPR